MYTKEINLLQEKQPKDYFDEAKKKKETLVSVLLIAGFFTLIISVYLYSFYLGTQQDSLSTTVQAKEKSINSMKDREYLYRVAKIKIGAVAEILSKREDLVPVLDFVESVTGMIEKTTPDGIKLETIGVPDIRSITIAGVAKDSKILDSFITLLTETDLKPYFSRIKLTDLSRTDKEDYSFGLSLSLSQPLTK